MHSFHFGLENFTVSPSSLNAYASNRNHGAGAQKQPWRELLELQEPKDWLRLGASRMPELPIIREEEPRLWYEIALAQGR